MSSATGNPRNKVGLKPGHSLMDWIRLGNSGNDLAGTGGAYLSVTKAQLAEHNKRDDAWLSIRGKVYNVTRYMDFHPGGPEELMKGAGTDATKMFNEVHAWVNYESILQKCVVGQLTTTCDEDIEIVPSLSPPETPTKTKSGSRQNCTTVPNKPYQMDWFQQVGSISLVFYTKTCGPDVHVHLESEDLLRIKITNRVQHLRLESAVSWPCSVLVDGNGKVQIKLTKRKPGLWSRYGTMETSAGNVAEYWEVAIVNSTVITHDTRQIDFMYTQNVFNYVPVSHHVFVKANINGEDVVRPYTPVTSLAGISIPPAGCVRLLVKGYPSGTLSSWLTSQPVGTRLHLSLPMGSFNLQPLASITHLVLLAAGTGFTPMIPLITWALRSTRSKVQLIFFNKSEKDVIWQEQLDKLMTDNSRFSVEHILSEPSSQWSGKTGHINLSLLQSYLPVSSVDIPNTYYVCVCGPTSFTQLTERCLKEDLGYTTNNYYCFLGQ
uniref:Uncharacterized protein n=1 Tax=Cuerna arida TaxID=1464854 RepID=A0A1B6GQD8_9HEMI